MQTLLIGLLIVVILVCWYSVKLYIKSWHKPDIEAMEKAFGINSSKKFKFPKQRRITVKSSNRKK
jgi:hypothetical protein